MERDPTSIKWSEPDVGALLDGLSYERESDPKYPIATRALGLAMAVKKKARHDAMGPQEFMTANMARDRLVVIGGSGDLFDLAKKYLDRVDAAMVPTTVDPEAGALFVRRAAPRLANVTNLTVISFSIVDGVKAAFASTAGSQASTEIAADYYNACTAMTVVRLALLLDRDDESFQGVYRSLCHPEVVEALIRQADDDELQPVLIGENICHAANEFLRIYRTIDWPLHSRLLHFRNLGLAHLGGELSQRPTYEELRGLVGLVRKLAACLAPLTEHVPPIDDYEISERTKKAAAIWGAVLRKA